MSNIRTLLTHRDTDIDEIEAFRLLRRYGEEKYPGVSTAAIKTVGKRDSFDEEGTLPVGIGGGAFDEHPFGERARREGECAATLVAKDLGIDTRPELQANIGYALEKNYSANTWEFEIAPLEKLAFRYLTHSADEHQNKVMEQKIFNACFLLLNAVEESEKLRLEGTPLPAEPKISMDELVADWILKQFGPTPWPFEMYKLKAKESATSVAVQVAKATKHAEDRVFYWILQFAKKHKTAEFKQASFDLADLCMSAEALNYPKEQITETAEIFLTAIWHKYKNFFVDCKRDFNSAATRIATLTRGAETLRVASVLSANPEIAKYARSEQGGYSAVVIKRDPATGNMQIFFNQKFNLDPAPVVREIRLAERAVKGLGELEDAALTAEGKVEGALEWFYDGHQLLNGSYTAEETPTKLSREEVEQAVMRGLRSIDGII